MELKETKNSLNSVGINVVNQTDRNNSENKGIYNILFPSSDENTDTSIESNYYDNSVEKPKFGNVSTLDWLKTWRSTQIS